MEFKSGAEISLENYVQPPETEGECLLPDLNEQPLDDMMQSKLEPEIVLEDFGHQQQTPAEFMQSAIQDFNQQSQRSEKRIISFIREENKSLRAEIASLNSKLAWLAETVVGIKDILNKGPQGQDFERSDLNFPLKTEFDLSFIDKEIGESPTFKNECIKEMRTLFGLKALSKSLTSVMSPELVLDYNVDGVASKKSLRDYRFFFAALTDAIRQADSSQPAIKLLQKAMHCVKNNACKRKSRMDQETKSKKARVEH
ncbi:uncharacterized protein LOC110177194 [Drosophila serrata]|uniref:uncharacterized protein LOC110177194 n=1 Tax=Drosophila serrata TaxID=7274 RepID=UPI000A1CF925|nr:uncharacterized protein LOC110177194 [Drosophila serrata]